MVGRVDNGFQRGLYSSVGEEGRKETEKKTGDEIFPRGKS